MKLAIMQPYLFPYIGYFQLVAAVNKFVFYDDVNFIKNGWINRNRLYLADEVRYITVPLAGASPFLKINEISVVENDLWRKKLIESIRHSYAKAPHFSPVNTFFTEVLFSNSLNIAELAIASVVAISTYLELSVQFVKSSTCYDNRNLVGSERIIDICKRENADQYYNLPGGQNLYSKEQFNSAGVNLHFVYPNLSPYKQIANQFQPGLSMIDVLMFNDRKAILEMLSTNGTGQGSH